MKKLLYLIAGFIVLLLLYFLFFRSSTSRSPLSVVPEDAVYILETENFTETWEEVSATNIWQFLIRTPGFESWQETDSLLKKYFIQNQITSSLFKNRPVAMSAHLTAPDDYDFIYVIDLKSLREVKELTKWMGSADNQQFKFVKNKYKEQIFYKIKTDEDDLYLTYIDNLMIFSYSFPLIKKVLDEREKKHWINRHDYKFIEEKLPGGLVRIWFNYKQIHRFAQIYFEGAGQSMKFISEQLSLTGLDTDHRSNIIDARGITLTDSIPSYFNAMLDVKPGAISAYEIASKRTALYMSLGFKNFNMFHQSLLEYYAQTDKSKRDDYRRSLKKIERYFKIDLQEDFFDWIGKEIALVKLRVYHDKRKPEEVLLLIHATDPDDARKGINKISEQIRKKSPFKFKTYKYKNFEIRYLHQKSFFKTVLGAMFKDITKPYYTFIDEYVVFSNSEQSLKDFIDDYVMGNTLSHDEYFMNFASRWNEKAHFHLYLNMPKFYPVMQQMLTDEGLKSLKEKEDFLLSFHRIVFQLTGRSDYFDTRVLIDHNPEARKQEEAERLAYQIDETVHHKYYEDLQFKFFFPDTVEVPEGKYIEHYSDGKIKVEGKIRHHKPVGFWRTFYPSGNLESVVFYEDGEINGDAFFYYDSKPAVKKAEMKFEKDQLTGVYREYYRNGALKAELRYKKGLLHGEAKYFYPTGQLKAAGKFKKGEKKGKWLYYDKQGQVIKKEKYSGWF